MRNAKKFLTAIVFSVAISLIFLLVVPVNALSVSKPSIPEFTVDFVDASYDVPTTTSTDSYTGETVTHSGYHVQNRTIEVSIKNQPATVYEEDGRLVKLYLNIRTKGAYAENWTNIYNPDNGFLTQSSGEYTTVSYSIDDNEFPFWENLMQGGTVEFQVEALNGTVYRTAEFASWFFEGEESGWSNTKTVDVPTSANPSPTVPELSALAAATLLVGATMAAVVILRKKVKTA